MRRFLLSNQTVATLCSGTDSLRSIKSFFQRDVEYSNSLLFGLLKVELVAIRFENITIEVDGLPFVAKLRLSSDCYKLESSASLESNYRLRKALKPLIGYKPSMGTT